jgi:two-component system osmolarity sensor histidine kinase EnvZ
MSVPDDQARTDMVADIEQASAIIGQFMDYARPHHMPSAPAISLLPVLQQAAHGYQHLEDVVLQTEWAADETSLICRADPVDVLRLVNNLLENARRYGKTPPLEAQTIAHAHIHLSVRLEGTHCVIQVADNGPGVDTAILSQMTRPFFRADTARSHSVGAGLGLAVVEKLLLRLGGRLDLLSPGPITALPRHRGLCAALWLPRAS